MGRLIGYTFGLLIFNHRTIHLSKLMMAKGGSCDD